MAQNSTRHQEKQSEQGAGAQEAPPWGGGASAGSATSECPPTVTSTPATRHGTTRPVLSLMTTKASFWAPPVQLSLQACPQIPAQPWGRGAGQSYGQGRAQPRGGEERAGHGALPRPHPHQLKTPHMQLLHPSAEGRDFTGLSEKSVFSTTQLTSPKPREGRRAALGCQRLSGNVAGLPGWCLWPLGWGLGLDVGGGGSRPHLYPKPPSYF